MRARAPSGMALSPRPVPPRVSPPLRHVVTDGGCTCPGDLAKAFGGGADFVMLGGMFAGHDESAGELVQQGDKWFKSFYGMSSAVAMHKHSGGVAE